jgi:UrcA family protein
MKTLKHHLAAMTIACLASLAHQAFADPVYRPESPLTPETATTVRADDLDLTKPEDVQSLYERIRGAARSLCEVEHSAPWDIKRSKHKRECFEQAVDRAVARTNEPALTALHRAEERVASR